MFFSENRDVVLNQRVTNTPRFTHIISSVLGIKSDPLVLLQWSIQFVISLTHTCTHSPKHLLGWSVKLAGRICLSSHQHIWLKSSVTFKSVHEKSISHSLFIDIISDALSLISNSWIMLLFN